MHLRDINGIGEKTEEKLNRLGIFAPEDLVRYYPAAYDVYEEPIPITKLCIGAKCAVRGAVKAAPRSAVINGKTITTAVVSDGEGSVRLRWFNSAYINGIIRAGN
ncbi:MAG: ATP-dependent DNA helicase RecG, partial [Lachnospiraceae bacterium]|nr:ATP-dependent DNA helicase RecG [Lachnospiraceae bacterium]